MIFWKIWCLVVTSNSVKLKSISSWPKMRAKITENRFRFHFHFKWFSALENRREREKKSKKIADVEARQSHRFDRSNPPSSNLVTDHQDHFAISGPRAKRETKRVERSSHREPTRTDEARRTHSRRQTLTNPLAPTNPDEPTRAAPWTHSHRFVLVLVLVWNFCNKICLWFWFFTFSLWSLILLLLLWWRGWWCFGGFPVVWWWVLCG